MKPAKVVVCCCLMIAAVLVPSARGHGRLIKPPSRGSMWRFGYKTPPNYSDNQLWCGGRTTQYNVNGGKCGLCGDPYQGPLEHEAGGKYAKGIIVDTFMQGGTIEVDVDITANHKGWFEFRLCANNDPSRKITQECLDQHLLKVAGSEETRIFIGTTIGIIKTYLDLPADLTCTQCVLQWKYNTGNSWGTDPDGTSCLGCGDQEQFYGCSDVAISKDGASGEGTAPPPTSGTTTTTKPPTQTTTKSPTQTTTTPSDDDSGGSQGNCVATGNYSGDESMDEWCHNNCAMGYCPATHCTCGGTDKDGQPRMDCMAVGSWIGQASMDKWCKVNCPAGNCPKSHCLCADSLYDKLIKLATLYKSGEPEIMHEKKGVATQYQGQFEQ